MTCMTSVGFGNVASETDNEKIFSIFMMVISGETKKKIIFYLFILLNFFCIAKVNQKSKVSVNYSKKI